MSRVGDGSTGYLKNSSISPGSYPFTLFIRMYWSSLGSIRERLYHIAHSSIGANFALVDITGTGDTPASVLQFRLRSNINPGFFNASNTVSAGSWQTAVCIAAASNDRRCVLNGDWANSGTQTSSMNFPSLNFTSIGYDDASSNDHVTCRMAEAGISSTAWTQGMVEAYDAGVSAEIIDPAARIIPIWGNDSPEPDNKGTDWTVNGTLNQADHAPIIFPTRHLVFPAAAAAPGNAMPMAMHYYRTRRAA